MSKAILIISAGSSSRLGKAKQLVNYRGDTLINHVLKECLLSELGDIFLILGANKEKIETQLTPGKYKILFNENWVEGMGNTIAYAVSEVCATKPYEGLYIVLSDQIFLDHHLLEKIRSYTDVYPTKLIVSKYQEGQGPPSYFPAKYFRPLSKLTGDDGAKEIIQANRDEIIYVNFEKGNIDIDTPEDLKHLL